MQVILLFISLLLTLNAQAFEMLVKARSVTHPDATEDRVGRMKRGMIVDIRPDGFQWGAKEGLPRFALIKVPMVQPAQAAKYLAAQYSGTDTNGNPILYRPRLWQIRWADLPLSARNKLQDNGELVIKATDSYTGTFDYTWAQVKQYFRNLETGLDETDDL